MEILHPYSRWEKINLAAMRFSALPRSAKLTISFVSTDFSHTQPPQNSTDQCVLGLSVGR
jgi:hypothetical protein